MSFGQSERLNLSCEKIKPKQISFDLSKFKIENQKIEFEFLYKMVCLSLSPVETKPEKWKSFSKTRIEDILRHF